MKLPRLCAGVLMMLGAAVASQGCSAAADEEAGSAEGAATEGETINVSNAKVSLCGSVDDAVGCPQCPIKIGDHDLLPDALEACTLKPMRTGLQKRVEVLLSNAGRQGLFLRTAAGDEAAETGAVKLLKINVIPAVGAEKNARSQYTRLSGSFTTGEEPNASGVKGGVSVYSVNMPVVLSFDFQYKSRSGKVVRQETFPMSKTYDLTPFFYMKSELAVNLSVGSILSKFGVGPVASGLLSALGGNASLHVDAAHEVRWTTPVCADLSATAAKTSTSVLQAFDKDFLTSVLVPLCRQYKKDNDADVKCDLDPRVDYSTATLAERMGDIAKQRVLPIQGCTAIDTSLISANTYRLRFVAPAAWGFASGAEGFLYKANANAADVWKRGADMSVMGVEGTVGQACGLAKLKEGEVCVSTQIKSSSFGKSECSAVEKAGPRGFGIVQTSDDAKDEMISYTLPR